MIVCKLRFFKKYERYPTSIKTPRVLEVDNSNSERFDQGKNYRQEIANLSMDSTETPEFYYQLFLMKFTGTNQIFSVEELEAQDTVAAMSTSDGEPEEVGQDGDLAGYGEDDFSEASIAGSSVPAHDIDVDPLDWEFEEPTSEDEAFSAYDRMTELLSQTTEPLPSLPTVSDGSSVEEVFYGWATPLAPLPTLSTGSSDEEVFYGFPTPVVGPGFDNYQARRQWGFRTDPKRSASTMSAQSVEFLGEVNKLEVTLDDLQSPPPPPRELVRDMSITSSSVIFLGEVEVITLSTASPSTTRSSNGSVIVVGTGDAAQADLYCACGEEKASPADLKRLGLHLNCSKCWQNQHWCLHCDFQRGGTR